MSSGGQQKAAYAHYRARRHFSSLDGLRAVSVVAVIWHHSVGGAGILGQGFHGVDLFFVISGFLITTLLLREHEAEGRIAFRAFYVRRALRIFPLYYATLAAFLTLWFLGLRGTHTGNFFIANLPAYATYTTNWFAVPKMGEQVYFYHAWSLATEEQFYLLWPPLLILLLRYRRGLLWAGTSIGMIAFSDLALTYLTTGDSFMRVVATSIATPICMGALVAALLHSQNGYALARRVLSHRFVPIFAALANVAILWLRPDDLTLAMAFAFLVAACCITDDHYLRPFLAWRPVQYVGRISYGMYLTHPLVIGLVAVAFADSAPAFILTMAGTLAVASASYRYFETPFLRLKKRYSPGMSSVASAPAQLAGGRVAASSPRPIYQSTDVEPLG